MEAKMLQKLFGIYKPSERGEALIDRLTKLNDKPVISNDGLTEPAKS